jgi:hypothetical protein
MALRCVVVVEVEERSWQDSAEGFVPNALGEAD